MPAPIVTHRDPSIVQLFNLFADYINQIVGGAGGPVITTNVIRVDKGGSDATGTRNDFSKPFLTIQAAVNNAQDKDLILVGPGTFAEQVTVPPTIGVSILGSGLAETLINFAVQALIWNPSVDTNFIVSGIGFPSGGIAVSPSIATVGVTGLISFSDLQLAPGPAFGIELTRTNVALVTSCSGSGAGTSILAVRNCANILVDSGKFFSVDSVYDLSQPVPSSPGRELSINNSSVINVAHSVVSEVSISNSSVQLGVLSILNDHVSGVNGSLRASDSELGDVIVTTTFVNVPAPVIAADINRCGMKDLTTDAVASAIRVQVRARSCVLNPINPINAGANVDLDLRGSDYPQILLQSTGAFPNEGRINRSMYRFVPAVAPNPPGLIPVGPAIVPIPIPYVDIDYTVVFEFSSPGGDAYVVNPSKTVGGFTAGTSIPGGTAAEIMILQQ